MANPFDPDPIEEQEGKSFEEVTGDDSEGQLRDRRSERDQRDFVGSDDEEEQNQQDSQPRDRRDERDQRDIVGDSRSDSIAEEAGNVGPSANTGGSGGATDDLPEERSLGGGGAVREEDVPEVEGVSQQTARDATEQLEAQTLSDLESGDISLETQETEQGTRLTGRLSQGGRQREIAQRSEAALAGTQAADPFRREDIQRNADTANFQEVTDQTNAARSKDIVRADLRRQVDEEFPNADLGQDEIEISETDTDSGTQFQATLTDEGRKEIARERAPGQGIPVIEGISEKGAELNFEYKEFRRENRGRFDKIVRERGRSALGTASDIGQNLDPMPEQGVTVEFGADSADISKEGALAGAGAAVAAPEPVSTGTGLAVGGAIVGGSIAANELNRPVSPAVTSSQPTSELPEPENLGISEPEISTPQQPSSTGEIEAPDEAIGSPSEIEAPQGSVGAVGELDVPSQTGEQMGEITVPTVETQQLIQRERFDEETTPEITDEEFNPDLPAPREVPPSNRERQRRDDLDVFERSFPTGGSAIVSEDVTEPQIRQEDLADESMGTEPGTIDETLTAPTVGTVPFADTGTRSDVAQAQEQAQDQLQVPTQTPMGLSRPGLTIDQLEVATPEETIVEQTEMTFEPVTDAMVERSSTRRPMLGMDLPSGDGDDDIPGGGFGEIQFQFEGPDAGDLVFGDADDFTF